MRNILFRLTAVVALFMFVTGPCFSENKPTLATAVFLIDYSDSMREAKLPMTTASGKRIYESNLSIQIEAIQMFLNSYSASCAGINIKYVPWGFKVGQPLSGTIVDWQSAHEFSQAIFDVSLSEEYSASTNHGAAMFAAADLLAGDYQTRILIFVTDEDAQPDLRADLSILVPSDVIVFGIGIGGDMASDYVRDYIIPEDGFAYGAYTAEEMNEVYAKAFQKLNTYLCSS